MRTTARRALPLCLTLGLAVLASGHIAAQKAAPVVAAHERLDRITQLIDRRIAAKEIPGAVALVAIDGEVVHFEARGQLDFGSKTSMPKDALFNLASLSKPVTAAVVLTFVEEGRLRLTDPVAQHLPEWGDLKVAANGGAPVAASRPITIHDLLTHTSGVVGPPKLPTDAKATLATYLPQFAKEPLEFQPGTRWNYSNTVAFDTLARIVEVVSGKAYEDVLRERVFIPLGMKDTGHVVDPSKKNRVAQRYDLTATGVKPNNPANTPQYYGGGWGLYSTAQDYFRFAQMLANKGEFDGKRILSPRSVELMQSIHVPDTMPGRTPGEGWGLAVRVISDNALRDTYLSRGSFGWSGASGTHFWVDPEKHLVAVLMAQVPAVTLRPDFETAVMQALVK
jgi:CubicO group peptidase (beta-lactamase class C family)